VLEAGVDEAVLGGRPTGGRGWGRAAKARRPWALLVLLVALVAPLLPGAPSSPAQAAVTEPVVEQLPDNISPQFINNAGVVAGTSFVGCCLQGAAATWDGGDVVRRPMTGTLVRLVGFNDAGLIAGTTSSGHAVWSPSGPSFLAMPNLGSNRGVPIIYGPNTAGGVVGAISWRQGEANGVRWATPTSSPQLLSTISTLMGMAPNGDALGIAPGGVVGQPTFIRETPAGATSNVDGFPNADILDISSAGHILGSYWSGGAELVWHDGTVTNVPAALHGRAVNADGVVAGTVFTPEGNRAAVLQTSGEVAFLDDLAPTPQGIRFQQIYDINNSCAMAVQGRVMEDGVDRVRYYRVQLPDCSNNLTVEITERPDESVEVGAEFLIEATIRNESTSDTLTNLTLVDGGLAASEGVEVVAGPLWTPVSSLAPGASATVGWLLTSANVGVQQVEVQASGSVGGTTVSRTAGTPVTVIPPVDIVVDSGQTVDTAPGEEFEVNVTVRNEWDKPLADIKPEAIEGPNAGSITKVSGPLGPDGEDATLGGYDLNPEESVRFTYTLRLEEDVWPAIITARFTGRDPETDTIFFVSGSSAPPDGIGVEIAAERAGSKLTVTTTVSNETGGPVEELGTSGIVDEPVSDGEGGVVPSPLTNARTDHPLPDTLAAGEEVEIVTELDIVGLGLAVLSESIAGLAGAEPVGGFDIVSIEVGEGEVTVLDAEQAAADGLQTALGTLGETNQLIIEAFTEEVSEVTDTRVIDPGVQRMIDDYKSLGFSDYWAEQLTVWDYERTTFDERAAAGWVEFKAQLNRRGASASDSVGSFLDTVTSPTKTAAFVNEVYRSGITNLGYLGDVSAMHGPELLAVAIPANIELAEKFEADLWFAWEGQQELREIERADFLANPTGTARTGGARVGGYGANGVVDAGIGMTAELATAGTSKLFGLAGRALVGEGLDVGMSPGRLGLGDGPGTDSLDPLSDTTSKLARLEQAQRDSLSALPPGTILELDELFSSRTGMHPDDAAFFQAQVKAMEDKYGFKFIASFRTAEAASIDIPNVLGKEEWNTFKAVGALDEAIGAPSTLRGQASVFAPVEMSSDALAEMQAINPGFVKQYMERYITQKNNWAEFQAGTSKMNKILDGSLLHAESGGIRIINDRPGVDAHGVTFLEQLDDATFIQSKGLTPSEAAVLKTELEGHPGLTQKYNVIAQNVDGGIGFSVKTAEGQIRPIGSDFDLQYFGPADGVWPPGKKGQIITEFMDRVGKNPRVPAHGASDLGFDMSSAAIKKLAEFEMLPYKGAAAGPKADQVLGRMQRVARDLRKQADNKERDALLNPNITPERRAALLKEVDGIRANADKIAGVTKDELLSYAKGEKLVTITKGDIRVGGEYVP
jgi:hypothetical protein